MSRTFIQPGQMSGSAAFSDSRTTGHEMIQSGSLRTLDDDLNNLRTLVKTVGGEDNWYENVVAVGGVQRNLKQLHTHLDGLMSGSRPQAGVTLEGNLKQTGTTFDVDTSGAITVDSSGAAISLDAAAASNFTTSAGALTLSGSDGLVLGGSSVEFHVDGGYDVANGLLLTSGSADVSSFLSNFSAGDQDLVGALNYLHSISSDTAVTKQTYVASGSVSADIAIENIILQASSWNSDHVCVYLNGVLQRSGSLNFGDVYRDSSSNLKFNFDLEDGDFIAVTSGSVGAGISGESSGSSGRILNSVYAQNSSYGGEYGNSITTVTPSDDTIPQYSEGELILTAPSITTISASSKIRVTATAPCYVPGAGYAGILFIHHGTSGDGDSAVAFVASSAHHRLPITVMYEMDSPGIGSALTFKLLGGVSSAAASNHLGINGASGNRIFGGTSFCTIQVEEILPV